MSHSKILKTVDANIGFQLLYCLPKSRGFFVLLCFWILVVVLLLDFYSSL